MSWALDLLRALHAQLSDPDDECTAQLAPCGSDLCFRLCNAAHLLVCGQTEEPVRELEALVEVAHGNLAAAAKLSPVICWRRLYTDACLLRSLADVIIENHSSSHVAKSSCIPRLDHAIIVAGSAGKGRLDLILNVIEKVQAEFFPVRPFATDMAPPSPDLRPHISPLESASTVVPSLKASPSFASFQQQFSREPFILRGFALDWPAMKEHPWSSVHYLRSVSGPGRVVPIEVGQDYRSDDWTQKMMSWDDFLDNLWPRDDRLSEVLYLAQHNLLKQFPGLRADIILPDYAYACLPPPASFPDYEPPRNDEQLVLNAWLGPRGTISPAHTDPYFNFYVQVVGRKTVWLAPPSVSSSMYPYPPRSITDDNQSHNPASNTTNPSMSNTSRVDVFSVNPDSAQHSLFWENVPPNAMRATLEAGDMLFFPPGWWHAMRSEEISFSVSMWF